MCKHIISQRTRESGLHTHSFVEISQFLSMETNMLQMQKMQKIFKDMNKNSEVLILWPQGVTGIQVLLTISPLNQHNPGVPAHNYHSTLVYLYITTLMCPM